jgi:PAS domain S-box-containing protein
MTAQAWTILLPGVIIILFGAVLTAGLMSYYRRQLGLRKETKEAVGKTTFIITAFQEVTRQLKEKEKELRRLKALAEQRAENVESYNENILQCVMSGVMTFDKECVLTTINRAAEEMLGADRAQSIGSTCGELFGDGAVSGEVRKTLEQNSPSARMEAMLERPGGAIWLGFNTAVLTDGRGDALGVILSFSDLTEVKRLQERMELRERLIALGEMSAGIAHELRNPMAVMAGYLKLLSKKAAPEDLAVINDITAEIDGMNRIIGDLLTFARPATMNRADVDVRELLEGCVANVLQARGENAAPVEAVLSLDEARAFVDEVLMRQAFTNLAQNAVDAMPDGGTLSVEERSGKDLVIEVRDTGPGIPPDLLKKIFLPFFTTKDKGVGLGLALAHKIILSHGGRIEVGSDEGRGTVFTVTLPKGQA